MKAARENRQITFKGTPIRLTADFSAETLQARREWHDILKVMKEREGERVKEREKEREDLD